MSTTNINTEIVPSNVTSTGTVSFRDGNPVIQFIIGEQDRLLSGQSIRFQGKFRALLSSASSSSSDVSNLVPCFVSPCHHVQRRCDGSYV